MNWQPIETAPKDRTRILLYRNGHIVCGHWTEDRFSHRPKPHWTHDNINVFGKTDARDAPPSHWMPLPGKPEAS